MYFQLQRMRITFEVANNKVGFFFSKRCCKSLGNYRFSASDGFCASENNLSLYIKVYISLVVFSHLEFNKRSDTQQKKLIWIFLPGATTLEQL